MSEKCKSRQWCWPARLMSLAFWVMPVKYGVEPGEFKIVVGPSARDQDLLDAALLVTK